MQTLIIGLDNLKISTLYYKKEDQFTDKAQNFVSSIRNQNLHHMTASSSPGLNSHFRAKTGSSLNYWLENRIEKIQNIFRQANELYSKINSCEIFATFSRLHSIVYFFWEELEKLKFVNWSEFLWFRLLKETRPHPAILRLFRNDSTIAYGH